MSLKGNHTQTKQRTKEGNAKEHSKTSSVRQDGVKGGVKIFHSNKTSKDWG